MNTNDEVLIEIKNLHVNFEVREGIIKALKGVNFKVKKGETLGLVGESGCGKSVTAQAILRIIPEQGNITKGEIMINKNSSSQEIISLDAKGKEMKDIRRNDISIIFQEPMTALSPIHTIGFQINESITLAEDISENEARKKAINLLRKVGIPEPEERVDSYTFQLSGGMRQRAMIAMALASAPKLLIADEPTTAIDVTIQAQILDLLKEIQEDLEMSIIIITHDLGVIAAISDRIAVMYCGRIVEKASREELFKNPKIPYTEGLLESIPDIEDLSGGKLETIKGVVPPPRTEIQGCDFHPRCKYVRKGICDKEIPEEISIDSGHKVSCFLYSKEGESADGRK